MVAPFQGEGLVRVRPARGRRALQLQGHQPAYGDYALGSKKFAMSGPSFEYFKKLAQLTDAALGHFVVEREHDGEAFYVETVLMSSSTETDFSSRHRSRSYMKMTMLMAIYRLVERAVVAFGQNARPLEE